jgi:hypothetical protein
MLKSSERTFGEILNTWVQTIGILAAGLWAAYTFVYKEIKVPSSAPVNVSVSLQLKKIGPKGITSEKQPIVAVEMQAGASNPSVRTVYPLNSAWIARGCNIETGANEASFAKEAEVSLNSSPQDYADISVTHISCSNVAAGHLFGDTTLKPGESTHRINIFYVPTNKYDEIDVDVRVITTDHPDAVALLWKLQPGGLRPTLYRVGKDGKRTEFEKDQTGEYLARELERVGVQEAHSAASLSLWQQ